MRPIVEVIYQSFIVVTIVKILLVITSCFVLDYVINRLSNIIYKKVKNTKYMLTDILIVTIKKPALILIWSYGILYCFKLIETKISFGLYNIVYKLRSFVVIYCVSLFVITSINRCTKKIIIKKERNKEKIDFGLIEFLRKLTLILSLTVVIIGGLEYVGVNIKGLMAIGGIGGIAIGFASKDLLSNLLGGFSIFMDKPFTVGDWVSSPDKNIEGVVEKIGWRETKIMSFGNYPIYLPNFIFSEIIIENKGRMKSRLISETFPVKFSDFSKIEQATSEIREMLEKNPYIDDSSMKVSTLEKIGNNTLDILFYASSNITSFVEYMKIKENILIRVIEILDKHNIQLEKRSMIV